MWPQIKQSAGDAGSGSEGQPSPCGLAEEEVIVQTGSGPGVSADPRFSQAGLGLIAAELEAPRRLTIPPLQRAADPSPRTGSLPQTPQILALCAWGC